MSHCVELTAVDPSFRLIPSVNLHEYMFPVSKTRQIAELDFWMIKITKTPLK